MLGITCKYCFCLSLFRYSYVSVTFADYTDLLSLLQSFGFVHTCLFLFVVVVVAFNMFLFASCFVCLPSSSIVKICLFLCFVLFAF